MNDDNCIIVHNEKYCKAESFWVEASLLMITLIIASLLVVLAAALANKIFDATRIGGK